MAGSVNKVTPDMLRELLRYDPETGLLYWLKRPSSMFGGGVQNPKSSAAAWNAKWAGSEAFTAVSNGYKYGRIFMANYSAHRVIWTLVHGEWPDADIDHISGDRSDNRLVNLRSVSHRDNCRNMTRSDANKSGVTGVMWDRHRGKWSAAIGGTKLGRFESKSAAISARRMAEKENGYHQNHGKASL